MNTRNDKKENILLEKFPTENGEYIDDELVEKWDRIFEVKESFAKDLEEARARKEIGSSLDSKVILYVKDDEYDFINENKENIAFVAIISELLNLMKEKW